MDAHPGHAHPELITVWQTASWFSSRDMGLNSTQGTLKKGVMYMGLNFN